MTDRGEISATGIGQHARCDAREVRTIVENSKGALQG